MAVPAACSALDHIFRLAERPNSILDVGCGPGAWARAAMEIGIKEVHGIDGISLEGSESLIEPEDFEVVDLEQEWALGRKFDWAF